MVYSLNEETGEVELGLVTDIFDRTAPEIYLVEVDDEVIESTDNHPYYVDGIGWTEAQDLEVGDSVVTLAGHLLPITNISIDSTPTKVYNFSVNGNANYYVSEDGILVHNCPKGVIYEVPGTHTNNGLPYIGKSTDWDTRKLHTADGRDRNFATVIDTFEVTGDKKIDNLVGSIAEQQAINSAGGTKVLDNLRNEMSLLRQGIHGVTGG